MLNSSLRFVLLATALGCAPSAHASTQLDLSGNWSFAMDRADQGISQRWQDRALEGRIKIPGILNAQGHGDEISVQTPWVLSLYDKEWHQREEYKAYTAPGKVKVPFLSQPPRHYLGAAWYQRSIEVPRAWAGKRVMLYLERPRWGSTVWLDGREIGSNRSLVAEHAYELGLLAPGKHRISVRVDNRKLMDYRPDSHSISDSLGMSWNGIIGKVELRATSPVYIDDAQIYPKVDERSALVRLRIGNAGGQAGSGSVLANGKRFPVRWSANGGSAEFRVQYPKNAKTWDEWQPVLQKLSLKLEGQRASDARELRFGFVDIKAKGSDILVNGRPTFMRGTHHGGDFPLTGYPPTDVAYWKRIFKINKDWGINHIRFHSFNPPEAAFIAADEVGMYLQAEPGMWNVVSPGTPMEAMLYEETERLIRAFGNHPSFLLLSPANEPKGNWKEAFDTWIAHYRKADPRRLYTNGTGHTEPNVPDVDKGTDYLAIQRIGPKPLRNKPGWFGRDYAASLTDISVPVLSHENGQWVAYPDFSVIDKFTGYLRPGNYEIFRESARAHGVLEKNKQFAWASGRFQLACYKEEIEAILRTRGMSGYQLLDLHDYLGQGTALVGILDTFWESKGYATPAEFKRFNGETVPLARVTDLVLTGRDTLDVPVEIAHYGAASLKGARPVWRVLDSAGKAVAQGRFDTLDIPIGKNTALGRIRASLAGLAAPAQYKLVVGLDGTRIANDWQFWVYPSELQSDAPPQVLVTQSWDEAEQRLQAGGSVLYLPRKADLDWRSPPLADVPVFWNRLMSPGWGRMLGMWIDHKHPALAAFPTEAHVNWQWMELVAGARAMNLDRLPPGLQPIVQPIDDWNRNYKLGMLFEARVGSGKLMVSSADLDSRLSERVVARQLRKSVLDYMASPAFAPHSAISAGAMRATLFDTRVMKKLGAKASGWPDAANSIDGDPNTYALLGVKGAAPRPQTPLIIEFPQTVPFNGLVLMPRQNHRDHEGDVRELLIQASDDGQAWRDIKRATLGSTFDPQTVQLEPVSARYLKLTPLSGFGDDRNSAFAEVALMYSGPRLAPEAGELEYKRSRSVTVDVDEAGMDSPKPGKAGSFDVAVTVDDLPVHGKLPPGVTRLAVTAAHLKAFEAHGVREAFGFVNAAKLASDPEGAAVLDAWRKAGHPLGNHTFTHMNLESAPSLEAWQADVIAGEPAVASRMQGANWRYLRFAYLSVGARHDPAFAFLRERGYRFADVSISFSDWMYTEAYSRCMARNDHAAIAAMKTEYLANVEREIAAAKANSQQVFGRAIPQVLLTHMGAWSAYTLPDVLARLDAAGARYITLEQAQADPAYATTGGGILTERVAQNKGIALAAYKPAQPKLDVDAMCK